MTNRRLPPTPDAVVRSGTATVEVETPTARYVLRATRVRAGLLSINVSVLISVERLTPRMPDPGTLMERYGLTPRQAEVVVLLARGLSDAEIAERLSISPHTVHHHTELVFLALGIHTRKGLGLKLLEDEGT